MDYKGIDLLTIKIETEDESIRHHYIQQGKAIYKAIQNKELPMPLLAEAFEIDQNMWGNPAYMNGDVEDGTSPVFKMDGPETIATVSIAEYPYDVADAFRIWRNHNDI